MRLFLYEYLSASGLAELTLRREGWAMLCALVEDFGAIPGVTILTLLDAHAPRDLGHDCLRVSSVQEADAFRQRARAADFTIVIAPEFDDLLAQRSDWAAQEGSVLLGSAPDAIRLVSDKAHLAKTLSRQGIPTPPLAAVHAAEARDMPVIDTFPLLCKPRFGAGCRGIRWIDAAAELSRQIAKARAEAPGVDLLLQRPVRGQPASAAFLIGRGRRIPLLAGYQNVRRHGDMLVYAGGTLPLEETLQDRAQRLAGLALDCFAGLNGFVGVDLILGDAADGSADCVIEINPRPTTAYVGLRRLCRENLAHVWLRLALGDAVPTPTWQSASLTFTPDGMITP